VNRIDKFNKHLTSIHFKWRVETIDISGSIATVGRYREVSLCQYQDIILKNFDLINTIPSRIKEELWQKMR
jgi:hypothetical protein